MRSFFIAAILFAPAAIAAAVESTVLTPLGHRPASKVHRVPAGGSALHDGDNLHILDASGSIVKSLKPTKGKVSFSQPDSKVKKAKREQTGWITYASWYDTSSDLINFFTSAWPVPETPANVGGQLLYWFNSIEPATGDAILQPVLQWGVSPAGGGQYYSVASWYVYGDQSLHTDTFPVNVGDQLTGNMVLTGPSGDNWNYQSYFVGIDGTILNVNNIAPLVWATITLEAYGVGSAADYPTGSTTFSGTTLTGLYGDSPSVSWSVADDSADNININVDADGGTNAQLTITY